MLFLDSASYCKSAIIDFLTWTYACHIEFLFKKSSWFEVWDLHLGLLVPQDYAAFLMGVFGKLEKSRLTYYRFWYDYNWGFLSIEFNEDLRCLVLVYGANVHWLSFSELSLHACLISFSFALWSHFISLFSTLSTLLDLSLGLLELLFIYGLNVH